jgi:hypothetical protein
MTGLPTMTPEWGQTLWEPHPSGIPSTCALSNFRWENCAVPVLLLDLVDQQQNKPVATFRLRSKRPGEVVQSGDWELVALKEFSWAQRLATVLEKCAKFPEKVQVPVPRFDDRPHFMQPWRVATRAQWELPGPVLVTLPTDDEFQKLRPHFEDIEHLTSKVCRWTGVGKAGVCGWSVTVPEPPVGFPHRNYFAGAQPAWLEDAVWRAYFQGLGFSATKDLLVLTVPSPKSFQRARALAGLQRLGMELDVVSSYRPQQNSAQWLKAIVQGKLPIGCASQPWIRAQRWIAEGGSRFANALQNIRYMNDSILVHDMAIHGWAFHRIPQEILESWRNRIRTELPNGWVWLGPVMDSHLPRFFEETLSVQCRDCWYQAQRPDDFDALFSAQESCLTRELEKAIQKCLAKKRMVFLSLWK